MSNEILLNCTSCLTPSSADKDDNDIDESSCRKFTCVEKSRTILLWRQFVQLFSKIIFTLKYLVNLVTKNSGQDRRQIWNSIRGHNNNNNDKRKVKKKERKKEEKNTNEQTNNEKTKTETNE